MTRTDTELSVVCREDVVPPEVRSEPGWRALTVVGPLDVTLVGVLESLTTALATAAVPVFVLSTFDTDHLLVREGDLPQAIDALCSGGHSVIAPRSGDGTGWTRWPPAQGATGSSASTWRARSKSSRVIPPASWVTRARVTRL